MVTRGTRPKIWVNAEPCGYGPASVAFNLFSQLKNLVDADDEACPLMEYVGTGIAFEFCSMLPWDSRYNVNPRSTEGMKELAALYHQHQPTLIVTVHDIPFAKILQSLGAQVVIFDSLMWYWQVGVPLLWKEEARQVWQRAAMVVCQNFVGVAECLQAERLTNATVVPAMLPILEFPEIRPDFQRKGTLVNFGGLQTHVMPISSNVEYARLILQGLCAAIEQRADESDQPIRALTSEKVKEALLDEFPFIESVSPYEARLALRKSRTSFLAAGMANIFDAVDYGNRVAFLPPVSKSHGLQLSLITQIGTLPYVIDWHDISGDTPLDYLNGEDDCFAQIDQAQKRCGGSEEGKQRLFRILKSFLTSSGGDANMLKRIPRVLGRGDGLDVAKAICSPQSGLKLKPRGRDPGDR